MRRAEEAGAGGIERERVHGKVTAIAGSIIGGHLELNLEPQVLLFPALENSPTIHCQGVYFSPPLQMWLSRS